MENKNEEGYTPMPEENEERNISNEAEDSKAVQDPSESKPAEQQEPSSFEKENDSRGALVGAVIIIGVLVIGGAYLYYQSGYYRIGSETQNDSPIVSPKEFPPEAPAPPAEPPEFTEPKGMTGEANTKASSTEEMEANEQSTTTTP